MAPQCLTGLINEIWRGVAKETRGLMDVWDAIGLETHQPGAGCICSNRIIGENQGPEWSRSAIQRSISFQWRMFFGQPYLVPGTMPNMFFIESVTPDQ